MDPTTRRLGLISGILIGVIFLALLLFALVSDRPGRFSFLKRGKVGVIEVEGVITDSRELLERIDGFRKEPSIRAVVVRIDSPGGAVAPVQEVYAEVLRLREEKPVVASLGSVSASGGYYVACAAERIFANPGTLTGSIGVLIELFNLEGLLEWARIEPKTIKSGRFKDIGSPLRRMTREEEESFQRLVDGIHGQFVRAVAESRGLPEEKVQEIAHGGVFSGEEALELGLVDELGGFRRAVEHVAAEVGITGEPVLVYPHGRFPRLRDLVGAVLPARLIRVQFLPGF